MSCTTRTMDVDSDVRTDSGRSRRRTFIAENSGRPVEAFARSWVSAIGKAPELSDSVGKFDPAEHCGLGGLCPLN